MNLQHDHGVHGTGSREYTKAEMDAFLDAMLQHVGRPNAITEVDLAKKLGIDGRTVRAIVAKLDGRPCIFGKAKRGIFICKYLEEALQHTWKMEAQIKTMQRRVDRRKKFQKRMPWREPGFFDTPGEEA